MWNSMTQTFASVELVEPLIRLEKIGVCREIVPLFGRRWADLIMLGLEKHMHYLVHGGGRKNFRLPRNAIGGLADFFGLNDPLPTNLTQEGLAQAKREKESFLDLARMLKTLADNGGGDPAVADFLRTTKTLLSQWQRDHTLGEAVHTVWRYGDAGGRLGVATILASGDVDNSVIDIFNYAVKRDGAAKPDFLALGMHNKNICSNCCRLFGKTGRNIDRKSVDLLPAGEEYEMLREPARWKTLNWADRKNDPAVAPPHPAIARGELNAYVLGPGMTNVGVPRNDMWWMVANGRLDFLEYLFADRPQKKRGVSDEDIMIFAATEHRQDRITRSVELLRMLERISRKEGGAKGMVGDFRDVFGHNLLWYSLAADFPFVVRGTAAKQMFKLSFRASFGDAFAHRGEDDRLILTPLQRYLYDLCDPTRKDAAGISVDDIINTPYKW